MSSFRGKPLNKRAESDALPADPLDVALDQSSKFLSLALKNVRDAMSSTVVADVFAGRAGRSECMNERCGMPLSSDMQNAGHRFCNPACRNEYDAIQAQRQRNRR